MVFGKIEDVFAKARANEYFRQVLVTGENTQVVIMSLMSGEEIGEETHDKEDQVLLCLEGEGEVIIEGEKSSYKTGDVVLVKHGTKHNFVNTGSTSMKIITTYSPPHHPDGTIHKTKEEAMNAGY